MWYDISQGFQDLIGREGDVSAGEMVLRAAIVYIVAVALVRLGQTRFMGRSTAFDLILGIMLGSVLSRAITGNAPFLPALAAGAMMVVLHSLFSTISFHVRWFGPWVKGTARVLVKDGTVRWDQMRKGHIAEHDLEHALYTSGKVTDVAEVEVARLERNGDISVIPRRRERSPKVIEIAVRAGVQTVRIELS